MSGNQKSDNIYHYPCVKAIFYSLFPNFYTSSFSRISCFIYMTIINKCKGQLSILPSFDLSTLSDRVDVYTSPCSALYVAITDRATSPSMTFKAVLFVVFFSLFSHLFVFRSLNPWISSLFLVYILF